MKVQVSSFPKSYSEDFWRIPKYSKSAPKVWHFRVKHHKWSWWKFCRRDMIYIALESSLRALSDAIERRGGQLFRFHVYFLLYQTQELIHEREDKPLQSGFIWHEIVVRLLSDKKVGIWAELYAETEKTELESGRLGHFFEFSVIFTQDRLFSAVNQLHHFRT